MRLRSFASLDFPRDGVPLLVIGHRVPAWSGLCRHRSHTFAEGLTSLGQEIYAGNSAGRIDVYTRSGTLLRTFTAPRVVEMAGHAGNYAAHRVALDPSETISGLDFGSRTNSPPTIITLATNEFYEEEFEATVGAVAVSDPDASEAFVFTVSDSRFEVPAGSLRL